MIIGHIGHFESYTSDTANGVKQVVYYLAKEQVAQGHTVYVYLYRKDAKKINREITLEGVNLVIMPAPKLSGFILDKLVVKHFKNNVDNLDLIHIHSVFVPSNNRLSNIIDIPYVITPHGGYSPNCYTRNRVSTLKKWLYFRLFEYKYIQNSKAIFCLDINESNTIPCKNQMANKVHVIPNGIELHSSEHEFGSDQILFIGRLDKTHKGLDLLVEGFINYIDNIKRENHFTLKIVGPDIYGHKKELKNMLRGTKAEKYVSFLDRVFGKDKEELLLHADVFVHTSRWEGLPMSVLEAMSYGIPVLISKETNLGEYVREANAGWVLDENTPDEITKILLKLNSEEFALKGKNAHSLIKNKFKWSQISRQIIEVYTNCHK